jgi:phage-related protein
MNIIDIIVRTRDETGPGVSSASQKANVLQGIFQGIGQKAAGMIAELPGKAIEFFGDAISKASDLGETVSKNQTIFGAASKELLVWAETAPKSLGMTKQAALDATGTLGNLFTQLGITADQARKMSQANVQLATDFASFHNADPTEVLDAMTAAYRGEYDAVQRFVPVLNGAKVEEEALAMTHKKSAKELTEKDKALAVDAIMLKNAGAASGDFARTSDSAANRARIAAASFDEMKTKIGNALLPAYTALLGVITGQFFPAMENVGRIIASVVSPAFETAKDAVRLFIGTFTGDGAEVSNISGVWMNRIIDLAAQVRYFVDEFVGGMRAVVAAFQAGDGDITSSGFPGFMERVGYIARLVFDWMAANIPPILDAIGGAFQRAMDVIAPFWENIKGNENLLITVAYILGTLVVAAVVALTMSMASLAVSVIAATWPFLAIVAVIFAVITAVRYAYDNWEWFRTGVQTVVEWLIANVPPILEAIRAAVEVAFTWIVTVAVPFIQNAFASFMGFLQGTLLPAVQTVWNAIYSAVETAVNFITPIISFLVDVIAMNFGHIAEIAQNIWDMIRNIISNVWQIISNIIQLGLNLITGNWGAAWENVKNIFSAVWDTIRNVVANGVGIIRELLQGLGSFIGNIAGRMFEGIKNGFINAINWVIDRWNGLSFTLPRVDFMGKTLGGNTISVPRIGRLAQGGITGGLALVGERGPELINLPQGSRVTPAGQTAAMLSAAQPIGGNVINLYVGGSIRSDRDLVRLMRDELTNLGFVGSSVGMAVAGGRL